MSDDASLLFGERSDYEDEEGIPYLTQVGMIWTGEECGWFR